MAFGMTDIPTLVVIDDDPHHIDIFIDATQNAASEPFKIECVKTLAEGVKRLKRTETRAVFVSLSLLDRQPLETFDEVSLAVPNAPILVMAGAGDAENALAVLQLGARGDLLADHLHRGSLVWAIRKMVEQTSADEALFTEEKRVPITLDSIGATSLNTHIQCRITSVCIVAGRSLSARHYLLDSEFKIREVLICRKGTRSTFLRE
jgi:DNA-binding NarL/FixJ family response regulator